MKTKTSKADEEKRENIFFFSFLSFPSNSQRRSSSSSLSLSLSLSLARFSRELLASTERYPSLDKNQTRSGKANNNNKKKPVKEEKQKTTREGRNFFSSFPLLSLSLSLSPTPLRGTPPVALEIKRPQWRLSLSFSLSLSLSFLEYFFASLIHHILDPWLLRAKIKVMWNTKTDSRLIHSSQF